MCWRSLSREASWLLPCTGSALLALLLNWHCSIYPLGESYDSLKYIGMAETILKGEWLGPYDQMTLIRSPVYSFLLSVNALMGWPLHVLQQVFYLASILILAFALRVSGLSNWRIVVVSVLCVFHPLPFYCANFVVTEAWYVPSATCVMAGALGLTAACLGSRIHYCFWMIIISTSLPLFWYLRPEGIWIIPFLIVCGLYFLRSAGMSRRFPWPRVLTALVLPVVCVYALGYGIRSLNQQYYGVAVIHELEEREFKRAFGWLTRLAPQAHRPHVPISQKAFDQAYKISPHFALLKPFLSQQVNGQGWTQFGCEWMGICDEIAGGWTVWAIRDAAASVGMYGSAPKARRFYADVAQEIQEACKNEEIQCSRNPTGNILAPPIWPVDFLRMAASLGRIILLMGSFGDFRFKADEWDLAHQCSSLVERYDKISHDQDGHFPPLYRYFSDIHLDFYMVLQGVGGLLLLVSGSLFLRGRFKASNRMMSEMASFPHWLVVCLLALIVGRLAVISYVDAMSYTAHIRYLLVVYPALMVIFGVILPPWGLGREKERVHEA